MPRITDVVKNLLIINVIIFFAATVLFPHLQGYLYLWPLGTENFAPYQVVSHMFMHGDLGHLFFNMFGLFMFGPPLESIWGPKKFLVFYLLAGFGAIAIHLFMTYMGFQVAAPVVGASGALYGVLVGFGMLFPETKLGIIFLPIQFKAKYFIPALIGLDVIGGFTGFSIFGRSIAHFAHVGGALTGFLLLLYWNKFDSRM